VSAIYTVIGQPTSESAQVKAYPVNTLDEKVALNRFSAHHRKEWRHFKKSSAFIRINYAKQYQERCALNTTPRCHLINTPLSLEIEIPDSWVLTAE